MSRPGDRVRQAAPRDPRARLGSAATVGRGGAAPAPLPAPGLRQARGLRAFPAAPGPVALREGSA